MTEATSARRELGTGSWELGTLVDQVAEAPNDPVAVTGGLLRVRRTYAEQRPEASQPGGVELPRDVREKEDFVRRPPELLGNPPVAVRIGFRPHLGVEVAAEELREVALFRDVSRVL